MSKASTAISHRDLLWDKQKGRCCYCGIQMRKPKKNASQCPNLATIEHIRRRADGGTNELRNKALACYRCNTERGEIDWLTYTSYRRGEIYLTELLQMQQYRDLTARDLPQHEKNMRQLSTA